MNHLFVHSTLAVWGCRYMCIPRLLLLYVYVPVYCVVVLSAKEMVWTRREAHRDGNPVHPAREAIEGAVRMCFDALRHSR